jgi:electron transport complex protein RnfB
MSTRDENNYQKLARKYGPTAGGPGFLKRCAELMTNEECGLILELFSPATPQALAQRLGQDEKEMATRLDNMARRGLLFRGKTEYVAWLDSHQFGARIAHNADEYILPGYLERRKEERLNQRKENSETTMRVERFKKTGVPLHRVIPYRLAIASNPNIKPEQVLWYEDMSEIIRRNGGAGVVDCPCRRIMQNCDRPLWVCLHFGWNIVEYEIGRGGRMKKLNVEEAIAASDLAETGGLVHLTPANSGLTPGVVCNCCSCCCGPLGGALAADVVHMEYAPSRYRSRVKLENCSGCQTCVEACHFGSIEMVKIPGSKKMKAQINAEKCYGCGACVLQCPSQAMVFELVRPVEHIPINAVVHRAGASYSEVK